MSAQNKIEFSDTRGELLAAAVVPTVAALRVLATPTINNLAITLAGYYASGDGGGGRFYWSSASTATDDGGMTIKPTAVSGAGRWLRFAPENRFNVRWWGAKGDNSTDDTTAIQAAINSAIAYGLTFPADMNYELFFPVGNYKLTASIILDGPGTPSTAQGFSLTGVSSGTYIFGSFDDYLFKKTSSGTPRGPFKICNIRFGNTLFPQTASGILYFQNMIQTTVDNCQFTSDGVCIRQTTNMFTTSVTNCGFSGIHSSGGVGASGSVGIWGQGTVMACDFAALGIAINAGGTIQGCRVEKCATGVQIGSGSTAATCNLSDVSFEANDIAIDIQNGARCSIDSISIQGSQLQPSPPIYSRYGIKITVLNSSRIARVNIAALFTQAGIEIGQGLGFPVDNYNEFENIVAANTMSNRPAWSIRNQFSRACFTNCNTPLSTSATAYTNSSVNMALKGLSQIDLLTGIVYSSNLRGKDVAVASGATFLDIVFGGNTTAPGGLGTLSAVAGGALANGTYYYTSTFVTQRGETYHGTEQSIALTGSNGTVHFTAVNVTATQSGVRRRIYRGTVSDTYDGYYDLPLNSATATYDDTGAAFDGFSRPPVSSAQTTSGAEVDANFSVTVAPQWNTTIWITSKATTGFRINFGTAPGSTTALDWQLIR